MHWSLTTLAVESRSMSDHSDPDEAEELKRSVLHSLASHDPCWPSEMFEHTMHHVATCRGLDSTEVVIPALIALAQLVDTLACSVERSTAAQPARHARDVSIAAVELRDLLEACHATPS